MDLLLVPKSGLKLRKLVITCSLLLLPLRFGSSLNSLGMGTPL